MKGSYLIDCFSENKTLYPKEYCIVAVDVIRATTTITTALNLRRQVYLALNTDEAALMARELESPLLIGELGGNVPFGFQLTNSPVQITALSCIPAGSFTDGSRPLVLVSSSGIPLILHSRSNCAVFAACLRNFKAVAHHISSRYDKIAIIGAGSRGNFRIEDQIGCAWLADELQKYGFEPEDRRSAKIRAKWMDCDINVIRQGDSSAYLNNSGQTHDLEFILHHINDHNVVPKLVGVRMTDVSDMKNPITSETQPYGRFSKHEHT